jgi:hypothetical protein
MSSEDHHKPLPEGEDKPEEEAKEEESKEEDQDKKEEELHNECSGCFPDSVYPPPPVLEEEVPDGHPHQKEQD